MGKEKERRKTMRKKKKKKKQTRMRQSRSERGRDRKKRWSSLRFLHSLSRQFICGCAHTHTRTHTNKMKTITQVFSGQHHYARGAGGGQWGSVQEENSPSRSAVGKLHGPDVSGCGMKHVIDCVDGSWFLQLSSRRLEMKNRRKCSELSGPITLTRVID